MNDSRLDVPGKGRYLPTRPRPLLGPGEPPPFEVLNLESPAPILLVCDHAGNRIPAALGNLGLDRAALELHVAHDIGAGAVTRELAILLDATAVLASYSRLVVDLNRPPGHPTSIIAANDGIAVPGNNDLAEAARAERLAALFWPYHRALADRLAQIGRRRPPILLAVHTFTPRMNGEDRRWHAGILWNRDPRLAQALIAGLSAPGDSIVGDNQPYSGRDLAYTLDVHADQAGLAHAAVEIRQDLVADLAGAHAWAERLADVLRPLIGRDDLHRIERFDR